MALGFWILRQNLFGEVVWNPQPELFWTHDKESLTSFHQCVNNFHPLISIYLDQSTQAHLLDTMVQLHKGQIITTSYHKLTDVYLQASSFHQEHNIKSIVYSQAFQYKQMFSEPWDRNSKPREFEPTFGDPRLETTNLQRMSELHY